MAWLTHRNITTRELEGKILGDWYAESRDCDAAIIKAQYNYIATSCIGILSTSILWKKEPRGDVPRIKFNYGWWFYSWSLTVVIQQLSRSRVSGLSKQKFRVEKCRGAKHRGCHSQWLKVLYYFWFERRLRPSLHPRDFGTCEFEV